MIGKIVKLSDSGKTALIAVKNNKRSIGYDQFAWAGTVEGDKVGDTIEDFNPTGTTACVDEQGEPIKYENGEPVLRWVF